MTKHRVAQAAALGILALIGWLLMEGGVYGSFLFLILPMLAGAVPVLFNPTLEDVAAWAGMRAAMIGCLLFLLIGIEGFVCTLMAIPIAAPLGALGGFLAANLRKPTNGGLMLALLPGSLVWDFTAQPVARPIVTSIEIAAPPETVWRYVVELPDIPEPTEWYFRAGIAYPTRARKQGNTRYCDFSTGSFVEPITVFDPPRKLAFDVTESPAPMREFSFYGDIHPKHLHGYMESERGQFVLTPMDGGKGTRVDGTSWYRHGLLPDFYWRIWSDAIVHRIHLRVLQQVKTLSERTPS
jgi:uncharacterized protein YndB with AHSA1/START domain